MRNLRVTVLEAVMILAAISVGTAPVRGQTATPTPSPTPTSAPQPCVGARRVYVSWTAKDPLATKVTVSATQCPAPPRCGAALPATVPPITLTITDATGQSLGSTITVPGVTRGSCPGGTDTYRAFPDRLRVIYGAATTVLGRVRIPQAQAAPPTLTAPLTFTLRDSSGYAIDGATSTCFLRQFGSGTFLKCF